MLKLLIIYFPLEKHYPNHFEFKKKKKKKDFYQLEVGIPIDCKSEEQSLRKLIFFFFINILPRDID